MITSHELPTAARFLGFVFVILVAALPAAAQQPPAQLTALADAGPLDIFQPAEKPPQPTLGPRFVPRTRENHKAFLGLAAAAYAAAFLDMHQTSSELPHFHEDDPLARPFLKLPTPLFYTSGIAMETGVNLVGWKMARSPRWQRAWWIAQSAAIFAHFGAYAYTKAHSRPAISPD